MKIGIVIAIERELISFLESSYKIEQRTNKKITYYYTKIANNEVYAIKSGFGLVDAASATQFLISCLDVELILNYGVTGALDPSLKVSDLFVVDKCLNYDFDTSGVDPVKKHQYMEFKDEFIPLNRELIDFAKSLKDIKEVNCCSGEQYVEDKKEKEKRFALNCQICDMELVAIARVCYLNDVKCFSIKCISDAYDGDGSQFVENVRKSSNKAFSLMSDILEKL